MLITLSAICVVVAVILFTIGVVKDVGRITHLNPDPKDQLFRLVIWYMACGLAFGLILLIIALRQ